MTEPTTHTLDVPTAQLAYDVRAPQTPGPAPTLLLIGSPMGAGGFPTLASHFTDRTVVTYDPRGVERSRRTDGKDRSTPEEHADDLHRIIAAIGGGPVDVFSSSGGAVNALALVSTHPEDVRTLVAHEPPLAALVEDREAALTVCRSIHETYLRGGSNAGMAHFIAVVSHKGLFTMEEATAPGPDPAMFGMPGGDDGTRDDALLAQNLISCTHFEPDIAALRNASTRIVPAVGIESEGELARRGGEAIARQLGVEPVVFPGGHGGFLGGEYGQMGDPEPFAAALRGVLDQA
jgi:pimeloyl-ACP methyl ester carboxylesterase